MFAPVQLHRLNHQNQWETYTINNGSGKNMLHFFTLIDSTNTTETITKLNPNHRPQLLNHPVFFLWMKNKGGFCLIDEAQKKYAFLAPTNEIQNYLKPLTWQAYLKNYQHQFEDEVDFINACNLPLSYLNHYQLMRPIDIFMFFTHQFETLAPQGNLEHPQKLTKAQIKKIIQANPEQFHDRDFHEQWISLSGILQSLIQPKTSWKHKIK